MTSRLTVYNHTHGMTSRLTVYNRAHGLARYHAYLLIIIHVVWHVIAIIGSGVTFLCLTFYLYMYVDFVFKFTRHAPLQISTPYK